MIRLKKDTPIGTIRIKSSDLKAYNKTKTGWKLANKEFAELNLVIKLFKAHNQFTTLIDTKDPTFIKGQLSPEGKEQGARINILPDGQKLEKAFSLFAPHLKIHDQDSHDHWDVLYQNKGGTWSYVYTLKKRQQHRAKKYSKVDQFEKKYPLLVKNVKKGLSDKNDFMAVPMYTLLTTHMRVGNEIYFRTHGHKGLTTLTRKDVLIKGNEVSFHYLSKDGVPIDVAYNFPSEYVKRLQKLMKEKKQSEFIFSHDNHHLSEQNFKRAFTKYCGEAFYPHIVRSHYATSAVKKFISERKSFTKKDVEELFLSIAHGLGHKKFDKKKQQWQEHYTVTVNSYIQPELVQKIQKLMK